MINHKDDLRSLLIPHCPTEPPFCSVVSYGNWRGKTKIRNSVYAFEDFLGGSEGKASAFNAGDLGSIPGWGRSPGEGNGNPLQYSYLENPMDGEAWWATVHGVTKSQTWLSDFPFTSTLYAFEGFFFFFKEVLYKIASPKQKMLLAFTQYLLCTKSG